MSEYYFVPEKHSGQVCVCVLVQYLGVSFRVIALREREGDISFVSWGKKLIFQLVADCFRLSPLGGTPAS